MRLALVTDAWLPQVNGVVTTLRTLQRHLQQAGTSYQQILDELRQELAEHYLLRSDLAIQDIACYLGFQNEKSFMRAFKAWTGQTPEGFRNKGQR